MKSSHTHLPFLLPCVFAFAAVARNSAQQVLGNGRQQVSSKAAQLPANPGRSGSRGRRGLQRDRVGGHHFFDVGLRRHRSRGRDNHGELVHATGRHACFLSKKCPGCFGCLRKLISLPRSVRVSKLWCDFFLLFFHRERTKGALRPAAK